MVEHKSIDLPSGGGDSEGQNVGRDNLEPMECGDVTKLSIGTVWLNYLVLNRPDLAVAVNCLATCMFNPKRGDENGLNRVLRYIPRKPACK